MIRPIYFLWIIAPITLYLIFLTWGLPSIVWNYKFRDNGQGYDPFAKRWYLSCNYVGIYGVHHYLPHDGKCPWFRFYKKQGAINGA